MDVSPQAQQIILFPAVVALIYYLQLVTGKKADDGSVEIGFLGWKVSLPSEQRVSGTVTKIVARLITQHFQHQCNVNSAFIRALESACIQPLRLRQARDFRWLRVVTGLVGAASVTWFVGQLLVPQAAGWTRLVGPVFFIGLIGYDLVLSLRLSAYVLEHEN